MVTRKSCQPANDGSADHRDLAGCLEQTHKDAGVPADGKYQAVLGTFKWVNFKTVIV